MTLAIGHFSFHHVSGQRKLKAQQDLAAIADLKVRQVESWLAERKSYAQSLAVADTVEAMATHRPYRPAVGLDAAPREIEHNSGVRYDAQVVAACLRLFREKNYQLSV